MSTDTDTLSSASALKFRVLAVVTLMVAVSLAYLHCARVPFIFDDRPGIERNDSIRHVWPLTIPLQPPVTAAGAAGRPIVNLSLAVNYAIGGLNPSGYHVANVAFHIVAALLLCGVVGRTLARVPAWRSRARTLALAIALLWAVHPLVTESVVCVIQRNEILASIFLLGTLYAFIRSTESSDHRVAWQIGSMACCLAGMATKETMVGAPLIVLLYDRAFVAGAAKNALSSRWRYYAALAATWLLLAALVAGHHERAGTVGFDLGTSPWRYLVTQFHAIALYLKLTLWPHPLVLDYGFALVPRLSDVGPQAILIVGIAIGTAWAVARNRRWAVIAACFFVLLAPSSSILPLTTQTIAEHRMYLPLACVVVGAVLALGLVLRRSAWVTIIALPLIVLTGQRVHVYSSEESIWADTIAKQPSNARAWSSLANVYVREERWQEAADLYARAVQLRPDYADAQNDDANVLMHLGRPADAVSHYASAARLKPEDDDIAVNYADALVATGALDRAAPVLQEVLTRNPQSFRALSSQGDTWLKLNRPADALPFFLRAVEVQPESGVAHNNAAVALMNLGRYGEAVKHYRAALRQMGGVALIHHNLALALDGAGRIAESVAEENEALRLDPAMTRAQEHLAELQQRAGNR